ncbi:MAG: AAA family ATPase [Candidatus Paceibacterota bacterium]
MKAKVIGITGQTGAGKDALCEQLKKINKKAIFLRFSTPLTEALNIFTNEIKKEDQQWLGRVLREHFGEDILARSIERKIKSLKGGLIILNGIRYESERQLLKKLGGKLVYIKADAKTRWQRVRSRKEKKDDNSSFEKFLEMDSASTERSILEIGQKADFIIANNGSLAELKDQLKSAMRCFKVKC